MKKIKSILLIALTVTLASCSNDDYTSKRHPEANDAQIEKALEKEAKQTSDKATDEALEESKDEENNKNNQAESEENVEDTEDLQNEADLEDDNSGLEDVEYKVNGQVNMRLFPSIDSNIVGEANEGDEIIFLTEVDGWSRVSVNGQVGYIRNDLLEKVN